MPVAIFQSPFYGLLASQIHLVFIAIALAYRDRIPEAMAPTRAELTLGGDGPAPAALVGAG